MAKMDILQLRKAIGREEFDHGILTSALSSYIAIDQKINDLLKSGAIVRVKKGLYVFGDESRQAAICKESLANLIYGPSCISMEYALFHYGFIPERVETITCVTPKRDKAFTTPIGRFSYRYLNLSKYPYGIEQLWIDKQHPILIASAEKALCDYIILKNIPAFAGKKSVSNFLQFDLRIEVDDWPRFNLKKMIRLNQHYNSENIARVMEVL